MTTILSTSTHANLMDRVYRHQRHIYDATRKYYLLGRDRMLDQLNADGQTVLEIGCGTGRNLIEAARHYPSAPVFGFDISNAMLRTARQSITRHGLDRRILIARADATAFEPGLTFGMTGFDRVFLSYTLSMIPGWQVTVENAIHCLNPGGSLHIVDFGQQQDLPKAFRSALHKWLAAFHVTPRADLIDTVERLAHSSQANLSVERLYRDYAWHVVVRKRP